MDTEDPDPTVCLHMPKDMFLHGTAHINENRGLEMTIAVCKNKDISISNWTDRSEQIINTKIRHPRIWHLIMVYTVCHVILQFLYTQSGPSY